MVIISPPRIGESLKETQRRTEQLLSVGREIREIQEMRDSLGKRRIQLHREMRTRR